MSPGTPGLVVSNRSVDGFLHIDNLLFVNYESLKREPCQARGWGGTLGFDKASPACDRNVSHGRR